MSNSIKILASNNLLWENIIKKSGTMKLYQIGKIGNMKKCIFILSHASSIFFIAISSPGLIIDFIFV